MQRKIKRIVENTGVDYASQLSPESKQIIQNVRNACKQVGELLYKNQDIFGYTDAKLYNVVYYADEKDINREWEWFLDDMWSDFKEFCSEHDLTVVPVRTSNSKFYIRSDSNNSVNYALDEIDDYKNHRGRPIKSMTADELGEFFVYSYWYNEMNYLSFDMDYLLNDNNLNDYIKGLDEKYEDAIDVANDEIYENWAELDVVERAIPVLNEIIAGYDYGEDFKANQLSIWDDYIAFQKEMNPDYDEE